MAAIKHELRRVLEPIVAEVRRGLRELDPAEIPATLRRVAASSDRRLPPPLLQSLLNELEGNDWLRGRLLEKLGDRVEPPTAAFLERGDGWWLDVVDRALAAAVPGREHGSTGAGVAEARQQATVAKQRLRELNVERDALRAEVASARKELRRRAGPDDLGDRIATLEADRARLEALLDTEREARQAAESRVAGLLRRRDRPQPSEGAPRHPRAPGESPGDVLAGAGLGDPVDAARRLDLEVAALAAGVRRWPRASTPIPDSEEDGRAAPLARPVLRLPHGIAPDAAEAVTWLLEESPPATVVVDGYNVTYLLDAPRFATGELRARLVGALGRMRRLAGTRHRIVVVFDSGDEDAGEPDIRRGVEVRFTSGGSADDAIVDLAGTERSPLVVFTNDRELRERVEATGALALWGKAIAEWSASS